MSGAALRVAVLSAAGVGLAGQVASAAVIDGFDSFAGASGSSVAGYSGWTDATVAAAKTAGNAATVVKDGTGYAGSTGFLRLVDAASTGTTTTACSCLVRKPKPMQAPAPSSQRVEPCSSARTTQ